MGDGNSAIEGGERSGHGRRRVALDDQEPRPDAIQDAGRLYDDLSSQGLERLPGGHQVEVDVRPDPEHVEHLIKHAPMLGGRQEDRLEPIG